MMNSSTNVAVLISGGGSGLQALIDATKVGILSARIALVVSSNGKAFGLQRAEREKIPTFVFRLKDYDTPEQATERLEAILVEHKIDYIALSGYMKLLPEAVVEKFAGRITNIHPALLPKFGGKGMYGHFVHEAVIAAGETESGVTIHLADEKYDNGRILEQVKVPVLAGDTPETLAARVLEQEHKLYPRVLDKLIKGRYDQDDE